MNQTKAGKTRAIQRLLLFATLLMAVTTSAQDVARFPIIDAPPKTPGIGPAFRYGSDNYIGETARADLIPLYLYEGKYIYAHGTSLGVHAFRNDILTLDVFARLRFRIALT